MLHHEHMAQLLGKAYHHAADSPDPSNQNGAVLVTRNNDGTYRVIGKGYNHFYEGIPAEVEDRAVKYQRIEHAERDCIFDAARRGESTEGSILVCPWAACYDCARAIIGSGVSALIYHEDRYLTTPDRWKPAVDEALQWMANAGLWVVNVKGEIPVSGNAFIIVNGKKWNPATGQHLAGE